MITQQRLKQLLHYDPLTGWFTNLVNRGSRAFKGERAGSSNGIYRKIGLDGLQYSEHVLAWFYVHGVWPEHEVDHENGDGEDNSLDNLREATHQQNIYNSDTPLPSSGYRGVRENGRRWEAIIKADQENIFLGSYLTKEEASSAYLAAAEKYHGEFAFHNRSTNPTAEPVEQQMLRGDEGSTEHKNLQPHLKG